MRLSFVSMVSGVLFALSILVLLHQNGSIYPTRTAAVGTIVFGLVLGIVLPTMTRQRAIRRARRR